MWTEMGTRDIGHQVRETVSLHRGWLTSAPSGVVRHVVWSKLHVGTIYSVDIVLFCTYRKKLVVINAQMPY